VSERSIDEILARQWTVLRGWLDRPLVTESLERPSVLEGWSVCDLIAHVGRCFTTIPTAVPVTDVAPLSLHGYVTGYASAADEIAEGTRALAVEFGDDLLGSVDRLAVEGFAALSALDAPIVRGPRGPIRRDDFVVTRIIELVVHADDLVRSVDASPDAALDGSAVATVAEALTSAYLEKTGRSAKGATTMEWIRAAAGRVPSEDPALPLF